MALIEESIKTLFVTDDEYWGLLKASKDIGTEYELDLAKNDAEAIDKIRQGDYDAIVSDASVKELDSITMLKEIRSKGTKTPFILLTGNGDEETAVEALENGANFYMPKTGDPHLHFAELGSMIYQSFWRSSRTPPR
jgi:DNA-binding response OmpR family regulator